jgi:hypothetical protein
MQFPWKASKRGKFRNVRNQTKDASLFSVHMKVQFLKAQLSIERFLLMFSASTSRIVFCLQLSLGVNSKEAQRMINGM